MINSFRKDSKIQAQGECRSGHVYVGLHAVKINFIRRGKTKEYKFW